MNHLPTNHMVESLKYVYECYEISKEVKEFIFTTESKFIADTWLDEKPYRMHVRKVKND
jgi:hypothetical protein